MNTDEDRDLLKALVFVWGFILFFASLSFASLTIYFKDGTSREVHKITFRDDKAELYQTDGKVITVPVSKLDLPSSGIGVPVGTYGTSRVTGERHTSEKLTLPAAPVRQARLQEEWDRSERSATVINTYGPMKQGDTVKIVGETTAKSRPGRNDYYDETEYWYDPASGRYQFTAKNLDQGYVIIYKNPDGTFGKRVLDAATFNAHFKIDTALKIPLPRQESPVVVEKQDSQIPENTSPPEPGPLPAEEVEKQAKEPIAESQGQSLPDPSEKVTPSQEEALQMEKSARRRTWIAYSIFLLVLIALGLGAWFVLVRFQKPFIDTSKFARYEEDLREFEIAIWLRNGKTAEQLMEICLKKFYQDSPSVLPICTRMLKGEQKALLVPFIAKQTGRSIAEADRIYVQILGQMERIRNLIRDVAQSTGIAPAKPPVEPLPQKTAIPEAKPVAAQPPGKPAAVLQPAPQAELVAESVSQPSVSVPAEEFERSISTLIEPEAPMRNAPDLPPYANNILHQIGFLSSAEEK